MHELTSSQAANILGLSHRTMNYHCRRGNVTAIKRYGQWLIKPSAVEAAKTMKGRGRGRKLSGQAKANGFTEHAKEIGE